MKRSGTKAVSSPFVAVRARVCSTTTRVSRDRSTQSPSASRSSVLTRAVSPHTSSSRTGVRSSIAVAAARKPSTAASGESRRPQAPRSLQAEKSLGQSMLCGTSSDHAPSGGSMYRSNSLPQDCPDDIHIAADVSHRVTAPSGSSGLSEPSSATREAERA